MLTDTWLENWRQQADNLIQYHLSKRRIFDYTTLHRHGGTAAIHVLYRQHFIFVKWHVSGSLSMESCTMGLHGTQLKWGEPLLIHPIHQPVGAVSHLALLLLFTR